MSTSSKENPKLIFDNIKKHLTDGVKERKHGFHTPVFSNLSKDLSIESRVVVMRKFDPEKMIINFHTDFRSPKVNSLNEFNKSLFVFYDHELKIQMRVKTISTVNNQNKITKQIWDETRLLSRKCYLTLKNPSSYTSLPEDGLPEHLINKEPELEESEIGYPNFTVVENKIYEIDWLFLEISGHRRLKIEFNNPDPTFQWIIP